MRSTCHKKAVLLSLGSIFIFCSELSALLPQKTNAVYSNEDVSLRFHAQWNVDEGTQERLHKTYGEKRVKFDQRGRPIPHGLTAAQIKRWENLYKLCMSDGCYYCDADVGSCESRTCGDNNEHCKPYTGPDGQPICGSICADYAFKLILTCSDLS
jgi:hypothetical protein